MKNYLIVGLLIVIASLVIGIEPVQRVINEATRKGTLIGIENCMSYSSSDLLSERAVRATCVRTFQKHLYHNDYATGRAGPRINQQTVGWGGGLENKTADHVTTWVKIAVGIFDVEGNEQEYFAETPIWIDPLDEAEFRVDLPDVKHEQFESFEFCEYNDPAPKACVTWGVIEIMGVTI
ncbi:hypothetical protein JMM59_10275 [Rhodovulum sulfidophilum]|uniref:hypothetical protein n=1 Tax=Rhodovulum sulfidophilum TaxID=35806 RepID=UPI001922E387|nr:hypothetical protein [Rhodovulum sulfidophilum]MBL3565386.1 hypothetical protein [Rhodovulum sulfidophilum]